jgi:hypothetical protein
LERHWDRQLVEQMDNWMAPLWALLMVMKLVLMMGIWKDCE